MNQASSMADPPACQDRQRLDKWLWAARFFKTRGAATSAINGGKVHIGGQRIKASRRVQPGVRVDITRGITRWEVIILALNSQRRPAVEAQRLYEETAESIALRTALSERHRQAERRRQQRAGRPDKHQRRQLSLLKHHPEE